MIFFKIIFLSLTWNLILSIQEKRDNKYFIKNNTFKYLYLFKSPSRVFLPPTPLVSSARKYKEVKLWK